MTCKKHTAFTLLELVIVIVIFGIVASIGSEIVSNLYNNYMRSRAINVLQTQTEITLEQITKRLQYRIKDSVRVSDNNGTTWISLGTQTATRGFKTIEWIEISNESFLGDYNGIENVPGWSGLLDMDHNNTRLATRTLETSGSRLDFAAEIIASLTNNDINMSNEAGQLPALIFKAQKPGYSINNYYPEGNNTYSVRVSKVAGMNTRFHIPIDDNLTDFNGDTFGDIHEQYYLSHTAYALDLVNTGVNDFNLTLHYNYQPWQNERFNDANTPRSVLAEHVSTFRIAQDESGVIRIKLCLHDNNQSIASDFDFGACKEKVIY